MLENADAKLDSARIENVTLANELAENFYYVNTFEMRERFDKIFFSYSITMIPAWRDAINNALNQFGADSNYADAQIAYNKEKLDALNSGLGALIDADLAKESARLQALQTKQQLASQSLSIANQAPQSLISLFRS